MVEGAYSGSRGTEVPSFAELLRRTPERPPPPTATPAVLPTDQIGWEGFERLIAEAVWLVDGLDSIRTFGRRGQTQHYLDLIGLRSGRRSVYQVRHTPTLTATLLRRAVVEFAGPSRSRTPESEWIDRPFEVARFVYATSSTKHDAQVELELAQLQDEYAGDLEIELYHGGHLGPRLRQRPALVYGIFGEHWAREWCGYVPPVGPTGVPDARALLDNPVHILGYGEVLARTEHLLTEEPDRAAEGFSQLARALESAGFAAGAAQLRDRERDAHQAAGNTAAAFTCTMTLLLRSYEAGRRSPQHACQAAALARSLAPPAADIAEVGAALDDWFEHGYDLARVTSGLQRIAAAGHPLVGRLVLAVAEQIVTDDDPADDTTGLAMVASSVLDRLAGLEQVRLRCCLGDLAVRAGTTAADAFAEVTRLAGLGHLGEPAEPFAALVARRAARALAFAGHTREARDHYRRAVREAANAHLGGDARDALRSVSFLLPIGQRHSTADSVTSITNRDRLLPGADQAALGALEELVEGKLPDALRDAHHWVRLERINGALYDENVARRRYGEVFARAQEYPAAVRQLVLAGARKPATQAAAAAHTHIPLTPFFTARYPNTVKTAAAAVAAAQGDLVPDDAVSRLAEELQSLPEEGAPVEVAKYALQALGALEHRLPVPVARSLLPILVDLVPRDEHRHRYTDDEMLSFFHAAAQLADPEVADTGARALADSLRYKIDGAENRLSALGPTRSWLLDEIAALADSGNDAAITILALWGLPTLPVLAAARDSARRILEQPAGQPRQDWGVGTTAQVGALLLHAALAHHHTPPTDDAAAEHDDLADQEPSLIELRDQVTEHLLAWAEDRHDIASSRATAVIALRILAPRLSPEARAAVCRRLITLSDTPACIRATSTSRRLRTR